MNPDTRLYYDRYVHNAALGMRIEQTIGSDSDWACVAYFYAALHLMNAYLTNKKNVRFDPKNAVHVNRQQAIDECPELKFPAKKFRKLKDLSEWVRYDPGFTFTPQHLAEAKIDFANFESLMVGKVKKLLGI